MIVRRDIREAVRILKEGGVVVFPTETAYALGCDARNAKAVRRVYALKGRSRRKPLACIAADTAMVRKFFLLSPLSSLLAKRHWPGPLTLVLPVRDARLRRALGLRAAGVRVTPHPVAAALAAGLGAPIVATSANRSGRGACYSLRSVLSSLGRDANRLVTIDGGRLPRRKPSTVVGFRRGKPIVFREGPIIIGKE